MPSTNWTFPTLARTTGTGQAWTNPTNIVSNDNNEASAGAVGAFTSQVLLGWGFGFTTTYVPAGAIITGVEVRCEVQGQGTLVRAYACLNSSVTTPATLPASTAVNQAVTNASVVYAATVGATELFGAAITDAQVRSSDFGVGISTSGTTQSIDCDYLQARINYEMPATAGFFMFMGF